jgi:hypothetical protein
LARMLRDREEERLAKESGANEVPSSRRRSLSRSIAKQAQARD